MTPFISKILPLDASEIGVLIGAVALILFIVWYFFGEREPAGHG